jgi:hypothetical protein
MNNRLVFALLSRQSLTESMARRQIGTLINFDGGIMCPDKWGTFEPLKTPFDAEDMDIPVRGLAKPHGDFFYRKGKPIQVSGEIYNRTHPSTARFPSPLFTNYWVGRFEGKWVDRVGIRRVQDCICEMFRVSGADFGFLTTEADLKAKNTNKHILSYSGMTLEDGVPGLYWLNLFSRGFAHWLGVDMIPRELAESRPLDGNALLIMFGANPERCRDVDVLQRQRVAIEWLGPDRFFDIRIPSRSATLPDWECIPVPNAISSD